MYENWEIFISFVCSLKMMKVVERNFPFHAPRSSYNGFMFRMRINELMMSSREKKVNELIWIIEACLHAHVGKKWIRSVGRVEESLVSSEKKSRKKSQSISNRACGWTSYILEFNYSWFRKWKRENSGKWKCWEILEKKIKNVELEPSHYTNRLELNLGTFLCISDSNDKQCGRAL